MPPPGDTKPITPSRRWAQWLAIVGDQAAATHLASSISAGQHMAGYCAENSIPYTTVRDWMARDEGRSAMYARAREDRADKLADEIVAISDELDVVTKVDGEETRLQLDPVAVARNRLRVDARKWVASKLKPRTYGDKLAVGGDADAPPIQTAATVTIDPSEAYLRMIGKT